MKIGPNPNQGAPNRLPKNAGAGKSETSQTPASASEARKAAETSIQKAADHVPAARQSTPPSSLQLTQTAQRMQRQLSEHASQLRTFANDLGTKTPALLQGMEADLQVMRGAGAGSLPEGMMDRVSGKTQAARLELEGISDEMLSNSNEPTFGPQTGARPDSGSAVPSPLALNSLQNATVTALDRGRAGLDDALTELDNLQETVRNKRQMASTAFQNFDQKTNQMYNMLSSIMKAMNEMRMGSVRNML